jgi:pimeloyl-ACP methyl ester carboxylesterase
VHGGPGVPLTELEEATIGAISEDRLVVVYDQAGTGRSDRLANPTAYTFRRAVTELKDVVTSTGAVKVDIFGYSWGASVATAFAVEHPEQVRRLALISPGTIPWRGTRPFAGGPQSRLDPLQQVATYFRALSPRNLFLYGLMATDPTAVRRFATEDELDRRFHELYESTGAGLHCTPDQIGPPPEHVGSLANQIPQIRPDGTGITPAQVEAAGPIPMLVFRGECDYLPARVAEEYVEVFDATLVDVAGAGHALLEDRPEHVLHALNEFLG